jgi:hypothetical protein
MNEAVEVFRRLANGEDKITSCEPEWRKAWCEHVEVKTWLGYRIVIFHRWGCWKYTDEVYAPDGRKLWHFDATPTEPQYELSEDERKRLDVVLPAVDPEHCFNKSETLRETDPLAWHRQEAKRLRDLYDASSPEVQSGFFGQYILAGAIAHENTITGMESAS